jgi:nucleoside-diphosphate-sugar epimerase
MYKYWLNKHAMEDAVRAAAAAAPSEGSQEGYRLETQLPWVDIRDIGVIITAAISDPGRFSHGEINLATEALTTTELAQKLGRALGKDGKPVDVKVQYWSKDELDEKIRAGYPAAPAM